ncbi:MAG: hypothetical protein ACJ8EL_15405 [Rhizomicrobium sp.]
MDDDIKRAEECRALSAKLRADAHTEHNMARRVLLVRLSEEYAQIAESWQSLAAITFK